MHRVIEGKLLAGYIYGDKKNHEYIYLPGSEIDSTNPLFIYETKESRQDISITEALHIIEKRSLRLTTHPVFGEKTL